MYTLFACIVILGFYISKKKTGNKKIDIKNWKEYFVCFTGIGVSGLKDFSSFSFTPINMLIELADPLKTYLFHH